MKKIIITLVVLAAIGGAAFLYMTRPVSAPSAIPLAPSVSSEVAIPGMETFVIVPEKSEAKFEIDEVPMSAPFHVVGVTKDVSGQISVNEKDPKASMVSPIQINARTLKTDSDMRNGAIGRMILKSETNEFITFTPTTVSALPDKFEIGVQYTFETTGQLTIAGTTKEAVFNVKARAVSNNEIQGIATSSLKYSDYNITIPSVPIVASVSDIVDLTFSFVAVKK
ncbi:YceI family protein [Candidatus Gracilibacteria bacterium]|nr:YceI family protein [Candidatus Gracilibacteria bacterium]